MKKIIVTIAAIIFLTCFTAAQADVDSLKRIIKQENNPSRKIDLLLRFCEKYRTSNPDSNLLTAREAIRLSLSINDKARVSKAEWYVTSYYYLTGHPDSSLAIAQKNIDWLKTQPGLQPLLAKFYSSSGLCYMKLDKQKEALDRFYIALAIAEKCDDITTELKAYVNIGWAMMELNQYKQAIHNLYKAIAFIREKKLPEMNLGVVYSNLASSYCSLNKIDSAYKYARAAVEVAHKYTDITTEANSLFILGTAQEKMGRLQDALQSFLQAQPLRQQVGDPFFIVSDLAELSLLYSKLDKTEEGIAAAQQALEIARTNDISAKLPMIYQALASNYEANKDFEKAAAIYKKINTLQDSIYTDANPKALAEMQTKYETEKKERTIEEQHNRIERQNSLFIGLASLILMISFLAYSQYHKYKLRKEAQLQAEVMKQQELAARAVIEAEEVERQRIARDLHDGIGQMMSAARMNLSAFESGITFSNEEQKHSFDAILDLIDDSCREVRLVSHNMMPNALLKNSLAAAIRDFTDKMDKKSLEVHLYTEGVDERMDSNTETILYRVIQECVNNVIKHAGATTLDISVIRDKDGISATIEDNGKGFDTLDKGKFEGVGLKNILTRIGFLKGTVEFDSAPGRGTAVSIHVPLATSL
ncbi:MAG: tetratricopeptide repeat protein [Bacteroidota bacterium]|nr:tetratricopeptide repeat protein [Bacteroidota bacterium]